MKKLGPGVDMELGMINTDCGLYLQPQPDGSMRVMSTNGEAPLATGTNLKADHTLDAKQWEMICAVRWIDPNASADDTVPPLYGRAAKRK
jgi:hypothetical protein